MADYELIDIVYIIAFVLVIIGGLNWGASALNYNLVDKLFGQGNVIGSAVYYTVALSALLLVIGFASKRIHFKKDEDCKNLKDCPKAPACPTGTSCPPGQKCMTTGPPGSNTVRMMRR